MQKELIMTNNPKDLQSLYLDIVAETVRFAAPRDNNADPLANYEALFGRSLPRLIGVSSGGSLQVTEELDQLITKVANILYGNSGRTETHSAEEYRKIVRAAFGDPLVRLDLRRDKEELAADLKEAVDVRVSNHFEENVRVYAFSCSMFEDGVFEPFSIGPVTFSSRQAWLQLSEQNGLVDAKTAERARQRLAGTDLDALTGAEASYEKSLFDLILEPRRNICSVETKSLGCLPARSGPWKQPIWQSQFCRSSSRPRLDFTAPHFLPMIPRRISNRLCPSLAIERFSPDFLAAIILLRVWMPRSFRRFFGITNRN